MHAYPEQLARLVYRRWQQPVRGESLFDLPVYGTPDPLPPRARLEQLLSLCYQASLLREEDRAVRFRVLFSAPTRLSADAAPLASLHALPFVRPHPLTVNEIRRLAAAAAFERALLGVRFRRGAGFEIWGLVHSGEQWLRTLEGARRSFPPLPPTLVVSVTGPGRVTVGKGSLVVARLQEGRLETPAPSLLETAGRNVEFEGVNTVFLAAHERERRRQRGRWAVINARFISQLRRQVTMRILNAMRRLDHGGTLLILPMNLVRQRHRWQRQLNLKYAFPPGGARRQLFTRIQHLLIALAQDVARRFGSAHQITWRDYLVSADPAVRQADEAITEQVRLLAALSGVDGAVVLGQPMELLGFGAEITGQLPPVKRVARALDAVAQRIELESTFNVGTRHRSAYRLCHALPGVIAAVVSQDGAMRIMKRAGNRVVYSQQLGTGWLDL